MRTGKVLYIFSVQLLFLLSFQLNAFENKNITYTLHRENNPTHDQSDAYSRIKSVMDSALVHYNNLTTITKNLNIHYNTGVKTADANFNGTIRFGANRFYMVVPTAMHEIAHTIGIGTTSQYKNLVKNRVFTGVRATAMLREITGDPKAVLKGDSQHFWPFGLNYASEVKSEQDLINHCKVVNAMYKDMFGEKTVMIQNKIQANSTEKIEIIIADGVLRVHSNGLLPERINIDIIDIRGRCIFQKLYSGNHTVDFSKALLPKGVYVANVNSGEWRKSCTFFWDKQ